MAMILIIIQLPLGLYTARTTDGRSGIDDGDDDDDGLHDDDAAMPDGKGKYVYNIYR